MTDQQIIIGIVRELQEMEKKLPSHGEGYGLDPSGVYDKGLTEQVIGMDNGVFYMEKKEVDFIIKSRNAFPSIAHSLLSLDENLKSMEMTNAALVKKLEVAMGALEKVKSGVDHPQGEKEHPDFYVVVKWSSDIAKEALSLLQSL